MKEIGFQERFERTDEGSIMDKNRELVPGSSCLKRERGLTTGLCVEGWYSEYLDVCRGMGLLRSEENLKGRPKPRSELIL